MCLSLLLVTGIGIDSGPSLAALLLAPLPLSAFFAPHRPFFVFWGLLPFLTRIWYLQLSRKKLVLNMKYVCFYFFRRRFWVQIGDRRRADIAAHPGSGCHHCTLHTAVSSLHIAHCSVICAHCTLHSTLSSLHAHCTLHCHQCKMHCHLCTLHTAVSSLQNALSSLHIAVSWVYIAHHTLLHGHILQTIQHNVITANCTQKSTPLSSPHIALSSLHSDSHYIEHCKLHTAKGKLHLQLHLVWFDLECIENCTESYTGLLYQCI